MTGDLGHTCCKLSFGNQYYSIGGGGVGGRRGERTGAGVREKEHNSKSKKSPCWYIARKSHTNKTLHQFIIMYTDGILSANIFHSHNGLYVLFTHIPQRPLQIVLSFLESGTVLPKEHRDDSLAGGCPTDDTKGWEFNGARNCKRKGR